MLLQRMVTCHEEYFFCSPCADASIKAETEESAHPARSTARRSSRTGAIAQGFAGCLTQARGAVASRSGRNPIGHALRPKDVKELVLEELERRAGFEPEHV